MKPIKEDEKKVLGIIALVFGGIALVTSWMPFINNASAVLAIIAFILGVIAFFINLKRKKTPVFDFNHDCRDFLYHCFGNTG